MCSMNKNKGQKETNKQRLMPNEQEKNNKDKYCVIESRMGSFFAFLPSVF